jgi:alpha-2-macroglobulin
MRRDRVAAFILVLCSAALVHAQADSPRSSLRVVSAGPTGEVEKIEQANEIRVVFSEPMVSLGQVAGRARPGFFHVTPAIAGTFRWSGSTILILTPAKRLPLATKYDVTIDASASAVSGHKLATPYTFSFTTPTVKLLSTSWYRPGGRYDAPPIVALRFNQPIKSSDVLAHLSARFQSHPFVAPGLTLAQQMRLRTSDPSALQAFTDKADRARAAASSNAPVSFTPAVDWDKKQFPPAKDLVVLTLTTPVPPESWVALQLDGRVPSLAGPAVAGAPQGYTVQVERTFFVKGIHCATACDPDYRNPIEFRVPVKTIVFAAALRVRDVTDARRERDVPKSAPKPRESFEQDASEGLTFEDAGYSTEPPVSTWLATLPATLEAEDGQKLGYTWAGTAETWHQRAFTSFGDGHGVWELGGGSLLPFYGRNFQNIRQWAVPLDLQHLMPALRTLEKSNFHTPPESAALDRRLGGAPDRILSHGLDLSKILKPSGTGLVWAAIEEGQPIPKARAWRDSNNEPAIRASVVQVTNLAISVKDSPQNTLLFVTRLDNASPVAGARVSIVKLDGQAAWTGTTGADGIAIAPQTRLRNPRRWDEFAFIVAAEKDGDVAYVGNTWNEGISPWEFGVSLDLEEADPLLRGSVFSDRGVYKLGEEVHLKAILRDNAPTGVHLLAPGTPVLISVRDSRNKIVDERTVKVNAWSTADWTFTLPAEGSLGDYEVRALLERDRPKPQPPRPGVEEEDDSDYRAWKKTVRGSFLVAAYRRPDFRVDVTLSGDSLIAGDPLKGVVAARYLFGAPMGKRPIHWAFTRAQISGAPDAITASYPADRWVFVGWSERQNRRAKTDMASAAAQLTPSGQLPLTLDTEANAGVPYSYTLEGDVEDVSRQHIANRTSKIVHPAPWYIGVKRPPTFFIDQKTGFKTELVAAGLDGKAVPDVPIDVKLTQIQWQSVRRAEGNGFYSWDTERKEVPAGEWHLKSALDPVPLDIAVPAGGYFELEARAEADRGRFTVTHMSFYVLGSGYTAWQRYDHNRIDLVADKTTYKPGDTAKIMIQSPWEQATALVTTEREGIRSHREFALTSTQQSIDIPITEQDIPNLYVSVLLVKGRSKPVTEAKNEDDPSDPGKPAFRLGYAQLGVDDGSKRLSVAVAANRQEYRPANTAKVTVDVKDRQGKGAASEVTLWAVDYGVLSLTGYHTPDVLGSVYVRKALQVLTEDTRQKIISRRVLTPKGETDGGGGGEDSGPGMVRRDFRVLAFWLGSVTTDANGHASADVKLPESLTTYRIMAVAGDRASRFGSADTEIRINKPVTLKAAFPRFLAVGDTASFGAVVTSQLKTAGQATVTIESLDPNVMQFADATPRTLDVPAGGSAEVRFDAAGRSVGRARIRVTVKLAGESDAFEDSLPVEVLASPETVSAVGEADDAKASAVERLKFPVGVVEGFGGLHVDLASTALVGLGEGARYLVEYPYGCAEQRGSRALAMLLSADLGDAFKLPGIEPAQLRTIVKGALKELERFQCPSGGFAYWPGDCMSTSPYLTAYLLHVFQVASDLKYDVDRGMRDRAYTYLQQKLAEQPPVNESWWPAYTAWQAFAVKVLVEGGRNQDSNITRLYGYRDRMPIFALAYLNDALVARGEGGGPRSADLRRRIANAILPEAATAHVEEMSDPYLMWFWNSNVRSTAIALNSLAKAGVGDAPYRPLVAWLMQVREKGRWGNTQENATALEALVSYYRRLEATVPDFTAQVTLGTKTLASERFQGRTTTAKSADIAMPALLASSAPGSEQPLTFTRNGSGTLFYSARLRYAVDALFLKGLDQGFRIARTYAPYVENGVKPAATTFKAGDLVRVTLTLDLTKERRFVAVIDPLPAGFEPVESWFTTSAAALSRHSEEQGDVEDDWMWWERGGFDHVERHDDRVELFATRLSEGRHTFTYVVRATTSGSFRTAPAHAEEMYEPEVFGRTATVVIDVKK